MLTCLTNANHSFQIAEATSEFLASAGDEEAAEKLVLGLLADDVQLR